MRSLLVLACLVMLLGAAVTCNAAHLISRFQAEQSVRQFENSAALHFTDADADEDDTGPDWSYRSWYILRVGVGRNLERIWEVDATTGEVVSAAYPDASPRDPSPKPFGKFNRDQCLQMAESYARQKYSGFDDMNFQLDKQDRAVEWVGYGWSFAWHQEVDYGAVGPNYVAVQINPAIRRIERYSSRRFAMTKPVEPKLSSQAAIDAAKLATGIVSQDSVEGPMLVADPDKTYWHMTLGGPDSRGGHRTYLVEVDAQSGEIIGKHPGVSVQNGPPMSLVAAQKQSRQFSKPSAKVIAADWVPIRPALAHLGYGVYWNARKLELRGMRRFNVIVLSIADRTAMINGVPVQLAKGPRFINDRTSVPKEFIELVPR